MTRRVGSSIVDVAIDIPIPEALGSVRKDSDLNFIDAAGHNDAKNCEGHKQKLSDMWSSLCGVVTFWMHPLVSAQRIMWTC